VVSTVVGYRKGDVVTAMEALRLADEALAVHSPCYADGQTNASRLGQARDAIRKVLAAGEDALVTSEANRAWLSARNQDLNATCQGLEAEVYGLQGKIGRLKGASRVLLAEVVLWMLVPGACGAEGRSDNVKQVITQLEKELE
jgi:hypothetical protein